MGSPIFAVYCPKSESCARGCVLRSEKQPVIWHGFWLQQTELLDFFLTSKASPSIQNPDFGVDIAKISNPLELHRNLKPAVRQAAIKSAASAASLESVSSRDPVGRYRGLPDGQKFKIAHRQKSAFSIGIPLGQGSSLQNHTTRILERGFSWTVELTKAA